MSLRSANYQRLLEMASAASAFTRAKKAFMLAAVRSSYTLAQPTGEVRLDIWKSELRARAAKTGESYTTALQHIPQPPDEAKIRSIRMAVAQTSLFNDPRDVAALHASGAEMRRLMRDGHKAGARLLHFPEGTTCWPHKRIMSETEPREIGPSDWTRFEWGALREELEETRRVASELKLWTIFGSVHELSSPHRPHNSLYVVSDRGSW